MKLLAVRTERRIAGVRFIGTVEKQNPAEIVEVYFDFASEEMADADLTPDAFAAAMLIPAMRGDEPLEIVPAITPRLHLQLPRIRDLFHTWYPEFARIEILSTAGTIDRAAPERAATFFSGGVDSFYTLLKYRSGAAALPYPLTHIVFMRGVETKLERSQGVSDAEVLVRATADRAGVAVITGETNFRTALQGPEKYIHWERHYHGSALAAVALALSPMFRAVCIPSAFTYNHLVRHGSSPLLDEMFSSDHLTILHDGAESDRAEKVGSIVRWDKDLVLENLRVCIKNNGGAINCGRCRKCVRTAVPLKVLGVLGEARLFEAIDTKNWAQSMSQDHPVLVGENRAFAVNNGADPGLLSIIDAAIGLRASTERRNRLKSLVRPIWRAFARRRVAL